MDFVSNKLPVGFSANKSTSSAAESNKTQSANNSEVFQLPNDQEGTSKNNGSIKEKSNYSLGDQGVDEELKDAPLQENIVIALGVSEEPVELEEDAEKGILNEEQQTLSNSQTGGEIAPLRPIDALKDYESTPKNVLEGNSEYTEADSETKIRKPGVLKNVSQEDVGDDLLVSGKSIEVLKGNSRTATESKNDSRKNIQINKSESTHEALGFESSKNKLSGEKSEELVSTSKKPISSKLGSGLSEQKSGQKEAARFVGESKVSEEPQEAKVSLKQARKSLDVRNSSRVEQVSSSADLVLRSNQEPLEGTVSAKDPVAMKRSASLGSGLEGLNEKTSKTGLPLASQESMSKLEQQDLVAKPKFGLLGRLDSSSSSSNFSDRQDSGQSSSDSSRSNNAKVELTKQDLNLKILENASNTSVNSPQESSLVRSAERAHAAVQSSIAPAIIQQIEKMQKNGVQGNWTKLSLNLEKRKDVNLHLRLVGNKLSIRLDASDDQATNALVSQWDNLQKVASEKGYGLEDLMLLGSASRSSYHSVENGDTGNARLSQMA